MSNNEITRGLQLGTTASASALVSDSMLVPSFGQLFPTWADMPPVLATVMVIGLMEEACVKLVHPQLPVGWTTLGQSVVMEHLAATPQGLSITAEAKLVGVSDRKLSFEIEGRDNVEIIGRGTHSRVVVDRSRFLSRLNSKLDAGAR